MSLLITYIKSLLGTEYEPVPFVSGKEMGRLSSFENAWLLLHEGKIEDFGTMKELDRKAFHGQFFQLKEIAANGKLVMPAFCDSHTHLVYAGSREVEYMDRIRGLSYEEIAKRGGGILNSAALLQATPEDELYEQSLSRVREIMRQGTGAVEIKSGYGLTTEAELKMLRVIRKLKETSPLDIKATFLGAHSIPLAYREDPDSYVDLVVGEMIPAVAGDGLADFIDVFCERGFFTVPQTERILEAGIANGLHPKIHANELDFSGGIQTGVKYRALSVDHLEYTGDEEIQCLLGSGTMPTLLPGASFFLGLKYAPAREMIKAGLPVALASDFNPGSSPSGDMKFIMSLGCIKLRMLPEEVLHAVTINTAYAMGLQETHGTICRGKKANLIITKEIPGLAYLPYAYGSDLIDTVILGGEIVRHSLSA
ncbi:MAG: imidazolonepropionase [Bacteroides sp. SM23_62]|nr:MAG: imidazolonepropionase [Bacteroides sp. SM23_62]